MEKSLATVVLVLMLCGLTSCLYRKHFYVDKRLSWTEAQSYCRLYHDDLSTISSSNENWLIPVTMTSLCYNETEYYTWCYYGRWIGLYSDSSTLAVWKWSGGGNSSFRMWASKEANDTNETECVFAHAITTEWYGVPCSMSLTFFCMEESPKLILIQQNMTWEEALDYCRNHYTDMASLLSEKMMFMAVYKTKEAQSTHVWIGLHFLVRNWIWVDGNALEYQAWPGEGQPQCPAASLRCGALVKEGQIWVQRDCEERHNFLCLRKWKI